MGKKQKTEISPKKPTVEEWGKILRESMLTDLELSQLEIEDIPRYLEERSSLRRGLISSTEG